MKGSIHCKFFLDLALKQRMIDRTFCLHMVILTAIAEIWYILKNKKNINIIIWMHPTVDSFCLSLVFKNKMFNKVSNAQRRSASIQKLHSKYVYRERIFFKFIKEYFVAKLGGVTSFSVNKGTRLLPSASWGPLIGNKKVTQTACAWKYYLYLRGAKWEI